MGTSKAAFPRRWRPQNRDSAWANLVDDHTRELSKIRSRMGQAYEDKLDGKIDERMWNDLHTRYTEQQEALERQISAHTATDRNYLQQGIQILELANKA